MGGLDSSRKSSVPIVQQEWPNLALKERDNCGNRDDIEQATMLLSLLY